MIKISSSITPVLLIGDMGNISDEVFKKGVEETRRIKGILTFPDGSTGEGTREYVFGDPVYRIGDTEVEDVMFLPTEYYGDPD